LATITNTSPDRHNTLADRRLKATREPTEIILLRADALCPADRELIKALYGDGRTAAEVAPILGVRAASVHRRSRRLVTRIFSDLFVFVLRNKDAWPATRRRIASEHFLQGRSLREIAGDLRVCLGTVRQHQRAVLTLFEHGAHAAA
jgi:DNA-directed RNA polymerase specialized sigma24 family protein